MIKGASMRSLAMLAAIILGLSIIGGPATLVLTRVKPRTRIGSIAHQILVTILGIFSILMGLVLINTKTSILVTLFGLVGVATGGWGITRIYRRNRKR
jgi:uncharacterized membrane protein